MLEIVREDAEASLEEHGIETTIEEFSRESSEVEIDHIAEAALAEQETIHNTFDVTVENVHDAMVSADDLGGQRV